MNTNKNVVQVVVAAVVVGVATKNYLQTRRQERQKREQIQSNIEKDITAIWAAAGTVQEMIQHGVYDDKSIADIQSDLEFYRIVSRED